MAYTIGSDKGKEIAKNMTVGSTYKASDGSTWKKNSDGSVSVTHQGVTTNNAYKPTSSSTSGGTSSNKGTTSSDTSTKTNYPSNSSVGSSGGSPSGQTWNANTDYQKLIDEAVAKGDYKAAAQYEQLRNQKINATGSNYATTNRFSGWLDNTDYGNIGKEQMANGASAEDIYETIMNRYNKSANTEGLQQYANDELQQAMWEYYKNALNEESQLTQEEWFENFEGIFNQQAPTYQSQYDPAITNLLNQILNRDDFSYDAQKDPLYQQYAAMYQQEGDRAMRDTMAEAAASAGGMNSYAVTAAQQANNYYNSQLGNKIPELYQLAYEMYLQDKESMVQDLGILQGLDNTQYNRYRDTMSDYYNDKNFAYGMYQDAVANGQWQQEFNYNAAINDRNYYYQVGRDTILDNRYANEWNYGVNQQEKAEAEAAKEQALQKAVALLELGQMPDTALLKAANMDEAYASAYLAGIKAQRTSTKSNGGTSKPTLTWQQVKEEIESGNTSPNVLEAYKYYMGETYKDVKGDGYINDGSAIGLGIGPVSNDTLEKLALAGAIVGDEDGHLYWADGWSANNYHERLNGLGGYSDLLTLPMYK